MNKRLVRRTRLALPGILANTDGGDAGGGAAAPAGDASGDAGTSGGNQGTSSGESGAQGTDSGQQSTSTEWDGKVESLPEAAQKMIRDLRTENADRRTKLTAAEQAQQDAIRALAKAAGIELPGSETEAPKPEELASQLTASQAAARQAAVELAVYKTASKHAGDPDALLDSRTFLAKVADLDPSAADFGTKVDEAIKSAVTDNPKLKAARAAGASSIDTTAGGSGSRVPRSTKPVPLHQAVAGHYGT